MAVKIFHCKPLRVKIIYDTTNGIASLDHTELGSIDNESEAIHALESMVLAHASSGIDIETLAYQQGIQTALDAITNWEG